MNPIGSIGNIFRKWERKPQLNKVQNIFELNESLYCNKNRSLIENEHKIVQNVH